MTAAVITTGFVRKLTTSLADDSLNAREALLRSDRLFSRLDTHMRSGAPCPGGWPQDVHDGALNVSATLAYDCLSECLRERLSDAEEASRARRDARSYWNELRALLRQGGWPEPWRIGQE